MQCYSKNAQKNHILFKMLESLPNEIVYTVLPFLDYNSLKLLRSCSKKLNNVVIVYLTKYAVLTTIEDVVARTMHGPYLPIAQHHSSVARILNNNVLHGIAESKTNKVQVTTMAVKSLNLAAGVLNGDMHFVELNTSRILYSANDATLFERVFGSMHFVIKHLRKKCVPDNFVAHLVSGMYTSTCASSMNDAFMSVLQTCAKMHLNFNDAMCILSCPMMGKKYTVATPRCYDVIVSTLCTDVKPKISGLAAWAMVFTLAARQNIVPSFGINFMPTFSTHNFAESGYNLNTYNCSDGYNSTAMLVMLVKTGAATPTYATLKTMFEFYQSNNIVDTNCRSTAVVMRNIYTLTCTLIYNVGYYLLSLQ
mgnify:CR=1 FL=1